MRNITSQAPRASDAAAAPTGRSKRRYVRPTLKTYGDLTQLTQQKGRTGQSQDADIANNNKTN